MTMHHISYFLAPKKAKLDWDIKIEEYCKENNLCTPLFFGVFDRHCRIMTPEQAYEKTVKDILKAHSDKSDTIQ